MYQIWVTARCTEIRPFVFFHQLETESFFWLCKSCIYTVSCFIDTNSTVELTEHALSLTVDATWMQIHHSKSFYTEMNDELPRYYHEICLYPTLFCLFSQVENPSQFIQGYRVLFRQTSGLPSPGPWQIQDLKVASERNITLSGLKKGIVYEIKVRPYFNEFQGADSESMTARTMEEGMSHISRNSAECMLQEIEDSVMPEHHVSMILTTFILRRRW